MMAWLNATVEFKLVREEPSGWATGGGPTVHINYVTFKSYTMCKLFVKDSWEVATVVASFAFRK